MLPFQGLLKLNYDSKKKQEEPALKGQNITTNGQSPFL